MPRLTAESVALLAPGPTRTMMTEGEAENSVAAVEAGHFQHAIRGKFRSGHGKQLALSRYGGRGTTVAHTRSKAAHGHRGPARHLAQVRKEAPDAKSVTIFEMHNKITRARNNRSI